MNDMNIVTTTLCAFALALPTGVAAQTFLEDPVEAEILQGWDLPDGSRMIGLRLTLDPGWKTYWRSPGDAGIPPQFDWARARNLSGVEITWPTPKVYEQNGMRSVGYSGEVVIPMRVTPARPDRTVRLRSTMTLGVCADVCIPHEITLDALLDDPDLTPTPAIVAAMAATPYGEDEAGVRSATCQLRRTDRGMEIEARVTLPHTGGTEYAVIETGTAGLWISEAATRRDGETLVAVSEMIHASGGSFAVNRSDVRITILGGSYAVDVRGCSGS